VPAVNAAAVVPAVMFVTFAVADVIALPASVIEAYTRYVAPGLIAPTAPPAAFWMTAAPITGGSVSTVKVALAVEAPPEPIA
jgi:hypothetical protein